MRHGIDARHIKFAFFPLVVLAGTFIIYSRQSHAWRETASTRQAPFGEDRCPSTTINEPDFVTADEITIQTPVLPHNYRSDGLLQVSSSASHPIHDLIAEAENKWHVKQNRASKNIREAFYEYQRRYGRLPPRGFDKWWDFITEHDVQLPDDYDQIWLDLELFWGMDPVELQRIQREQETHPESFTLVEEHIPAFRAIMSPLDNPYGFIDHDIKQAMLRAAKNKQRLKVQDLPPTNFRGWMSACPEHQIPLKRPPGKDYTEKTFIHDHGKTMDPCIHPKLLDIHGQFLSYNGHPPGPDRPMVPKFAFCSTTLHYDIRIPNLLSWVEDIHPHEYNPEWDDRPDERLSWRGSNTGMWQTAENKWKDSQRPRAVSLTNKMEGEVDVLFPSPNRDDPTGEGKKVARSKLNPALFDVAFAGAPLQCPEDYCDEIDQMFDWRRFQDTKGASRFKYVLDVDGNGWSSRFQRLMISNALVLKATIYPEWFLDRVQPWVHYVPIQVDLSDLYDTLIFFRGDAYGVGSHSDLARRIVQNSRKWAKEFWRKEDLIAYMFRLMLEYARVMSPDRDSMVFTI
ncbi:Beta-1,2-xylosyltransferase 1 [Leucoagaricus sp. SymC.cos]|nr:Beta-1,2-xylosyltransferase 1 [Leucoagaricus sp. SymC.cos]